MMPDLRQEGTDERENCQVPWCVQLEEHVSSTKLMKFRYLLIIATSLLGLTACKEKTPAEKVKDKVGDALDSRPNEKIRDAGEDAKDAAKDLGKGVKDAAKDAAK